MFDTLSRFGAFAVYQTVLLLGILAMPIALVARQVGLRLPIGDLVAAAGRTYERTK